MNRWHPHRRSNSVFLLASYGILRLGLTPEKAYEPFVNIYPPLVPFHDATPVPCSYNLTVFHCIQALYRAQQLRFFDPITFNVDEYECYDKVENGDLNWLVYDSHVSYMS